MMRRHGWTVAFPEHAFATVDHIVPTSSQQPFLDVMAEEMMSALERNCRDAGIRLWAPDSDNQGIVHVISPGVGTHAAGHDHRVRRQSHLDARRPRRHRLRHWDVAGARRADVWCLALDPLKVRRVDVNGRLKIAASTPRT